MRVLAEPLLFQSVHVQFSVPLYGGGHMRRGSNPDLAKIPLNNGPFIRTTFAAIANLSRAEQTRSLYVSLDIVFGPSLTHSLTLHHPTRAVGCVLLGVQAYRML